MIQLSSIIQNGSEQVQARSIPLISPPISLALSCDHSMLAVNFIQNGTSFISVFSVKSFLSNVSNSNFYSMHTF